MLQLHSNLQQLISTQYNKALETLQKDIVYGKESLTALLYFCMVLEVNANNRK